MLADANSKPNGGKPWEDQVDLMIGVRFYPPKTSKHYAYLFIDVKRPKSLKK